MLCLQGKQQTGMHAEDFLPSLRSTYSHPADSVDTSSGRQSDKVGFLAHDHCQSSPLGPEAATICLQGAVTALQSQPSTALRYLLVAEHAGRLQSCKGCTLRHSDCFQAEILPQVLSVSVLCNKSAEPVLSVTQPAGTYYV
jgi:hypothetical protein